MTENEREIRPIDIERCDRFMKAVREADSDLFNSTYDEMVTDEMSGREGVRPIMAVVNVLAARVINLAADTVPHVEAQGDLALRGLLSDLQGQLDTGASMEERNRLADLASHALLIEVLSSDKPTALGIDFVAPTGEALRDLADRQARQLAAFLSGVHGSREAALQLLQDNDWSSGD